MKFLIVSFFFFISIHIATSCDFCNCYVSINPLLNKNYIGVRYHFSPYTLNNMLESRLQNSGIDISGFSESRSVYEIFAQVYPLKKLQVQFSFPYIVNIERSPAGFDEDPVNEHEHSAGSTHLHPDVSFETSDNHSIYGISDPVIIANYNLIEAQSGDSIVVQHNLFLGGGIKIPVGKYKTDPNTSSHERLHMPGTGSLDYLLNVTYLVKRKQIGLNINSNFLFTNTNSQHYRFGNRFNGKASVFYEIRKGYLYLFPSLGPYFEIAQKDQLNKVPEFNTGGILMLSQANLDIYYKNISFSMELQLPIQQKLNGTQSEMDYRFVTGIKYAFN
jgi:hypothetical protein